MSPDPTRMAVILALVLGALSLSATLLAIAVHVLKTEAELQRARLFDRWRPSLMNFINGDEDAADELLRVDGSNRDLLLELITHMATLLKGNTFERLRYAVESTPLLPYLEKALRSHRDDRVTQAAVTASTLKLDKLRPNLLPLLDRNSPAVVFAAAIALARIGNAEDVSRVLKVLSDFSLTNQDAVILVMKIMAGNQPDHFVAQLPPVRNDPALWPLVLDALAATNIPDTNLIVLQELRAPASVQSLISAVTVAGEFRMPEAREDLRRLADDTDDQVRAATAGALGRLQDPADVPLLNRLLEDRSWPVRLNAASALGRIGGPELLTSAAGTSRDPHAVDMAVHALEYAEKNIPLL